MNAIINDSIFPRENLDRKQRIWLFYYFSSSSEYGELSKQPNPTFFVKIFLSVTQSIPIIRGLMNMKISYYFVTCYGLNSKN
tara:strand:+ start:66 stop:311 length:246 start_codon:yes stop_codon:yes gene_type:complete